MDWFWIYLRLIFPISWYVMGTNFFDVWNVFFDLSLIHSMIVFLQNRILCRRPILLIRLIPINLNFWVLSPIFCLNIYFLHMLHEIILTQSLIWCSLEFPCWSWSYWLSLQWKLTWWSNIVRLILRRTISILIDIKTCHAWTLYSLMFYVFSLRIALIW
jgi:hypothetical protein